ncbi:acyltransferase family protein [Dactylosporangium sp. NPDC048998]|uniref:acyltransferase family protein n=1 Tax=Dactylosporangium sp. NPDC048998 TaxID=3363976 RepID=UPI00371214C0
MTELARPVAEPFAEPLGEPAAEPAGAARRERPRLLGLDGIRGIAALAVMLHHCYLLAFPGYPSNNGPLWAAWLFYGHLAVVVFITLSGFSLGFSPAQHDWQLGGGARFAHRRAWRILPPYWAALVFSLIIAWTVVPQPDTPVPNGKSVVIFGLLLQDVFGSASPNGAFWSIAIEAQLYVVFPLMLLVLRRAGAIVLLTAVTLVVTTIGVLAPHVSAVQLLIRLTPEFAVLFALGLVATAVLRAGERVRRLPYHWLALAALVPPVALMAVRGSVWTATHYYWVDLAFGPGVALLLAAVATGRPRLLVRLLDTRPLRSLGSFSYSLYLTHAPIVVAIHAKLVEPHVSGTVPTFWANVGLAGPVAIAFAWSFSRFFELPFQRYRSWGPLRAAIRARLGRPRPVPGPVGEP